MNKRLLPALLLILSAIYIYPQQINVLKPKTGDNFNIGSEITILWNASGVTGNVRIVLRKSDNSDGYVIRDQYPVNMVPLKYKIPNNVAIGSYFIRIKQGTISGESGHFTIKKTLINPGSVSFNPPKVMYLSIPVTSPTVGSQYKRGDNIPIHWNSNIIKNYSKVHINLCTPNGDTELYTIGNAPPANTGHFLWNIPQTLELKDYIIKVSTPDKKISGKSAVFAISGSSEKPSITTSFYPHINNPANRVHWDNGNNACLTYNGALPLGVSPNGGLMRVGFRARINESGGCRWQDWDFFRGFLFFDITKAWGTIKSATLSIKLKERTESTPPAGTGVSNTYCDSEVEVHAVQGEWSVNNSGYHVTSTHIIDVHSLEGQRKNIDVTQLVKDAFKGGSPNTITFMVKNPPEHEQTLVFNQGDTSCIKYFQEIYLTIVYVPNF